MKKYQVYNARKSRSNAEIAENMPTANILGKLMTLNMYLYMYIHI